MPVIAPVRCRGPRRSPALLPLRHAAETTIFRMSWRPSIARIQATSLIPCNTTISNYIPHRNGCITIKLLVLYGLILSNVLYPTIPKNHHKWSWMGWIPTIPKWWVYCWVAHIKAKNSIQFWQKCCFGFVQPSPIFASVPHYKNILLCQVPQVMLNWPEVFDQIYVRLHQNEEKKQTVRAIQKIFYTLFKPHVPFF